MLGLASLQCCVLLHLMRRLIRGENIKNMWQLLCHSVVWSFWLMCNNIIFNNCNFDLFGLLQGKILFIFVKGLNTACTPFNLSFCLLKNYLYELCERVLLFEIQIFDIVFNIVCIYLYCSLTSYLLYIHIFKKYIKKL